MFTTRRAATRIALVGTLAGMAFAPAAQALSRPLIYWADRGADTIGVANIDGTAVNDNFITGANVPVGLAVDSQHVYWVNLGNATIGRANLNGSGAKQNFITGANSPEGIAVDDQHVYWANSGNGTIGEANLDGTAVDQSFITGASSPVQLAVDGDHVYWTNDGNGTIGRANLDGSGVNQSFITGTTDPFGLAVDDQHIYWTHSNSDIAVANIDGSAINQSLITGISEATGLAVDDQRLYWADFNSNTIGETNLDGTFGNRTFITVPLHGNPNGIAVSVPSVQVSSPSPFSPTPQGTLSQPQTLTITDAGQRPLSLAGLSFSGSDPGDFIVSSNGCLSSVAPGESCQLTVSFAPQGQGSRSATLQIVSNDFANSPFQVTLLGTGSGLPQGPSGATGPAGPQGATGPAGPRGQAGKVELVTCKQVKRHRHKVRKCTGRVVSGVVKFTASAHATIRRGAVTYATGVYARLGGGAMQLVLSELQPLRNGRYTLVLSHRRMTIRLAS